MGVFAPDGGQAFFSPRIQPVAVTNQTSLKEGFLIFTTIIEWMQ